MSYLEYIYIDDDLLTTNSRVINYFKEYARENCKEVFVLRAPLGETKYNYSVSYSYFILISKYKVIVVNEGDSDSDFDDYILDLIEDLGSIADKYNYRNVLGRPRTWRDSYFSEFSPMGDIEESLSEILASSALLDPASQKRSDLLISLLTGSINSIDRVGEDVPELILDKVKQKIQLFDSQQTSFIYGENETQKRVVIQGLSGTGKTELLLHKLKEIYMNEPDSRILFTCHNKILASSMRERIPSFFNFMKVQEQIEWEKRLWCIHAWGSRSNFNSGTLRYITNFFDLNFRIFQRGYDFDLACKDVLEELRKRGNLKEKPFDYIFIDESQDFKESFIELCETVSSKTVYVAGDIFQSIFDENIVGEIEPDFLLSKCYRTDPKTLMFSHALGMGLFEDMRLRWLTDQEWEACGYKISTNGNIYSMKREPLRRFEDIPQKDFKSVELIRSSLWEREDEKPENLVISIIQKIADENPTLKPSDIGITFSGSSNSLYKTADRIEFLIKNTFGWNVNKAYDTKVRIDDSVFISNKNNVKGLEFPFLICFSNEISNAPNERNALYMLLTRSFIKSYLVVSDYADADKMEKIQHGLQFLNDNGYLQVEKPTQDQILNLEASIKYDSDKKSLEEVALIVFDEYEVDQETRQLILGILRKSKNKAQTPKEIREFIEYNLEKISS